MKTKNYFLLVATCVTLSIFTIGCSSSTSETAKEAEAVADEMATKPDMAKVKTEIQALETAWATADNARDAKALAAYYADDAVSLSNNSPMIMGKAAIEKDIEAGFAKKAKGSTVVYDVMDVYGDENTVTEVGKGTAKDAAGKVIYTGKYMAIWEKRDGKYICVRDISNGDTKEK